MEEGTKYGQVDPRSRRNLTNWLLQQYEDLPEELRKSSEGILKGMREGGAFMPGGGAAMVAKDVVVGKSPEKFRSVVAKLLKLFPQKALDMVDEFVTSPTMGGASYSPRWWPKIHSEGAIGTAGTSKIEVGLKAGPEPSHYPYAITHEFLHPSWELMYPKTLENLYLKKLPAAEAHEKIVDAAAFKLLEKVGLSPKKVLGPFETYLNPEKLGPYEKQAENFLSQLLQRYGP